MTITDYFVRLSVHPSFTTDKFWFKMSVHKLLKQHKIFGNEEYVIFCRSLIAYITRDFREYAEDCVEVNVFSKGVKRQGEGVRYR